jgi:hypothetical protein
MKKPEEMFSAEISAQLEALEWALLLRHRFGSAGAVVDVKRAMPLQIRSEIILRVKVLKAELEYRERAQRGEEAMCRPLEQKTS